MEKQKNGMQARTRNWTRRQVLAAGGAALLTLTGCQTGSPAPTITQSTVSSVKLAPTSTPASPTPSATPVTLAFTGDVMFGRTVNTHMLATAHNDPFPFTYTADFLRNFDLTIGNL